MQLEDQAAASMSETQLMTKHFDRLVMLLKLLNVFCSQLDINRSCEKGRKKHRHYAELDFYIPIRSYKLSNVVVPIMGAVTPEMLCLIKVFMTPGNI